MSCERASAIDWAEFLEGRGGAADAGFRAHYPGCPECAAEVRVWTELHGALARPGPSAHPDEALLLAYDSSPAQLSDPQREHLRAHLTGCTSCREELAALRAFAPAANPAQPAGPPLWARAAGALRRVLGHPALGYALAALLLIPLARDALRETPAEPGLFAPPETERAAPQPERRERSAPPDLPAASIRAPLEEAAGATSGAPGPGGNASVPPVRVPESPPPPRPAPTAEAPELQESAAEASRPPESAAPTPTPEPEPVTRTGRGAGAGNRVAQEALRPAPAERLRTRSPAGALPQERAVAPTATLPSPSAGAPARREVPAPGADSGPVPRRAVAPLSVQTAEERDAAPARESPARIAFADAPSVSIALDSGAAGWILEIPSPRGLAPGTSVSVSLADAADRRALRERLVASGGPGAQPRPLEFRVPPGWLSAGRYTLEIRAPEDDAPRLRYDLLVEPGAPR